MSERIPTAEDIHLALVSVGYTEDEATEGIERIKRRGIGIGHLAAQETMQASIGGAFREAKAEVWDELVEAIEDELPFSVADEYPNPYREDESDE